MTTIPRNHTNVIAALKTQYPYAVAHLKGDNYTARVVEAHTAWDALSGHRSAALARYADRLKITVPLGWFDLFTDAAAYTATLPAKPQGERRPVIDVLRHRAAIGEVLRRAPEAKEGLRLNLRVADQALAHGRYTEARTGLHSARLELVRLGHAEDAATVESAIDALTPVIVWQHKTGAAQ